jgi:hypothetical protein
MMSNPIPIFSYNTQTHFYSIEPMNLFQKRAGFCEKVSYYCGFQHLALMKTVVEVLQEKVDQFESAKQPILSKKVTSLQDAKEQYQALYAKWPANSEGVPKIRDLFRILTWNDEGLMAAQGKLNIVLRKICQFVQMIFGCLRSKYESRLTELKPKLVDGLKPHYPREFAIGQTELKDGTQVCIRAQLMIDSNHCLQDGVSITLWTPNTSKPIGKMMMTCEEEFWDVAVSHEESSPEAKKILDTVMEEICFLEQGILIPPSYAILKGYKPGCLKLQTSSTQ